MQIGEPSCKIFGKRVPSPSSIRLHVDADRDGKVDDDTENTHKWEWGPKGSGAIVLVNDDNDVGLKFADNSDTIINGEADLNDLAPLELRCQGTIPPDTEVIVSVSDKSVVRVFDSFTSSGKEIIGPSTGDSYTIPKPEPANLLLGFEATRYADATFNGIIEFTLSLRDSTTTHFVQKVKAKVAPWMMLDHTRTAMEVHVSKTGSNGDFINTLKGQLLSLEVPLIEVSSDGDVWMQDCMEFGVSSSPTHILRTVVRAPRIEFVGPDAKRLSPLNTYAQTLTSGDMGFHDPHPMAPNSRLITFDSTGNLEVTPPVTSKRGKNYPFGRIYYGGDARKSYFKILGQTLEGETDEISSNLTAFLKAQCVQDPISLDTTWLAIGHVDEFMTFLPKGPKGFALLLASPRLALNILAAAPVATIFPNRTWIKRVPADIGKQTPMIETPIKLDIPVGEFLKKGGADHSWKALKKFNNVCQSHIDSSKETLIRELGLDTELDIIEAPQLYIPSDLVIGAADAFTGNMVNMLVVNGHCLIPKPFGPTRPKPVDADGIDTEDLFELDLAGKMRSLGIAYAFVDCWNSYHLYFGGIHCATNALRQAPLLRWWEFEGPTVP